MKTCYKCRRKQKITSFSKDRNRSDGYCGKCKRCKKEYDTANHQYNKTSKAKSNKNYRSKNATRIKEKRTRYLIENKNTLNKKNRDYYQANKEQIIPKKVEYQRKKLKTDPIYKLKRNVSRVIAHQLIKAKSTKNNNSVFTHLPFSVIQLKSHLENLFDFWMTWENRGRYNRATWNDNDPSSWTWQLDHIVPHSTFKYKDMNSEEFRKCWALSNLRPYSAKQNIMDGNRKQYR